MNWNAAAAVKGSYLLQQSAQAATAPHPQRACEGALAEIAAQMDDIWNLLERLDSVVVRISGGGASAGTPDQGRPSEAHLHGRLCAVAAAAAKIAARLRESVSQIEGFV